MTLTAPRLPRRFFARDPVIVARDLLGRTLFERQAAGLLAGRIVETEAYTGEADPASHAFRGPTARNRVMFGRPGMAYVYFTYGMHHCLNVTADREGVAGAVLLRALEPLAGQASMRARGDTGPERRLLSGPGKIGRAFGLTLADNGRDLTRGLIGIGAGTPVPEDEVVITRRIGISRGVQSLYRFAIRDSGSVSGLVRAGGR
ncbi:MAG TPA: DNA-3-methyladenine glycosylase [Candidatus Dormibacteraeota bacterium]